MKTWLWYTFKIFYTERNFYRTRILKLQYLKILPQIHTSLNVENILTTTMNGELGGKWEDVNTPLYISVKCRSPLHIIFHYLVECSTVCNKTSLPETHRKEAAKLMRAERAVCLVSEENSWAGQNSQGFRPHFSKIALKNGGTFHLQQSPATLTSLILKYNRCNKKLVS